MGSHAQRKVRSATPRPAARRDRLLREYQQRLKSMEQRFDGLIELSSDFYWEQDTDHRFTLLKGPLFAKTGVDPQELIGKKRWELFRAVPVGKDQSWEDHRRTLDAHAPFSDFLYKYPNRQGDVHFTSTSGQPVFDERGRFIGYRGIGRDVTARVQMERRLAIEQEVTQILSQATSVSEAASQVIEKMCGILGWSCGARWEADNETRTLTCVDTWGTDEAGIAEFLAATRQLSPLSIDGGGLARRACQEMKPAWIRNVTRESSFRRAAQAQTARLHNALAFPIRTDNRLVGALEFFGHESYQLDAELLKAAEYVSGAFGRFCERKRAEEELLRFRVAMDLLGDPVYLIDRATMRYIDFNATACQDSGFSREELLKMGPLDLSPTTKREDLERQYDEVIANPDKVFRAEFRTHSSRTGKAIIEAMRRAVKIGDRWMIVSIPRNISKRVLSERAMQRLSQMFASLSATNETIMRAKSPDELYQRVCDAAVNGGQFITTAVLLPVAEKKEMRVVAGAGSGDQRLRRFQISIDETRPEGNSLVGIAYRTQKPAVTNDYVNDARTKVWHTAAQETRVASCAVVPLVRAGRTTGVLLFYSDKRKVFDDEVVKLLERMAENVAFALDNFERDMERRRAEDRIQYLATHDALTGLPNRVMFSELLNNALQTARRYERKFAVLFIDLDRFKVINDTLGHEAGDILLKEMANRLKSCLRSSDFVARLGGDEFVVLVQEVYASEQIAVIARKILSAIMRPMDIMGQECRVTASIGVSMYPNDADGEQSLMKNADIAMYHAKEEGKNNFQFFSIDIRSQSLERLTLETNLRRALERNEFSLHYQAKLDFKTNKITGVEALLRWNNPDLGSVSPAHFIPLAEETGMIVPIGRWVLRTACEQNVAWQREGLPPVCMAVNLSARQFADDNLLDDIAAALKDSQMDPRLLELEITEGMVIHNPQRAIELLTAIKTMGVRLAIDDFGTGYSSLGQLKNFPIDTLKVDRSFIREIPKDSEDRAITEAIIAMGKTLSLTVVAEGVETQEQAEFLREHACDEMQGFYFSKPVAAEDFGDLLRKHVPAPSAP